MLLSDSDFTLRPKIAPSGNRVLTQFADGHLDIGFMSFNDATIQQHTDEVFEVHPLPLLSYSTHYYALRSSGLTPVLM